MRSQLKCIKPIAAKKYSLGGTADTSALYAGFAVARSPGQDKSAIDKKHRKPRCFDQPKKL